MTNRRFPPPWTIERLPGGFKVIDVNGQSFAYFYARENDNDVGTAGVLTVVAPQNKKLAHDRIALLRHRSRVRPAPPAWGNDAGSG
jgi:hypothetical protein